MKVDYLYVLPILASLDGDPGKRAETEGTARALFVRHSKKSTAAALILISRLWGDKFDSQLLQTVGDDVPIGPALGLKSDKPKALLDSPSAAKQDVKEPTEKEPNKNKAAPTVGLYLVFHSDGGGAVVDPDSMAAMIAKVVPENLHAAIKKISLFACDIADRGEGDPISDVMGKTFTEMHSRTKLIGGLQVMVGLLEGLAGRNIRPMICGYDIPVFAGEGPYKDGKPNRGFKKLNGKQWEETTHDDADIYGRKLTIRPGRQSLVPIRDLSASNADYKNLHKKVLRVDDNGRISNALAGWSAKND